MPQLLALLDEEPAKVRSRKLRERYSVAVEGFAMKVACRRVSSH